MNAKVLGVAIAVLVNGVPIALPLIDTLGFKKGGKIALACIAFLTLGAISAVHYAFKIYNLV